MSKAKTYNKGVESGLKVVQKIVEQEVEAMDYLKSKVDLIVEGHDEMKNAVDHLVEDADESAIASIYGICNSVRPNELKDHEQKMLINILATLSALGMNEDQKKYFNNLRHHLNIEGYEPDKSYDFRKIESIESVKSIKTIAKAVRIYLFLEDSNMDGIYKHEDDLFTYFVLRSVDVDEIDAIIETIYCLFGVDGLVEFYGDFEESGEADERNFTYSNVEEKEYIEISNECAQIYFKNCCDYDKNMAYIESSSYVVYNEGNNILCIHKSSGIKRIVLENVEEAGKFIREGKIVTYQDMVYYVINNDLFFINLGSMESGKICHIEEKKDDQGELYEVRRLMIYKGEKIIYNNGYQYYILDFEQGKESIKSFSISSESGKCFMRGDYLYYIQMDTDVDDFKGKGIKTGYRLKKYGILNDQETNVSEAFGKHDMMDGIKALYELEAEGIYADKYFCVFGYQGVLSPERVGFDCFYFNIDSSNAEPHSFYLWNARVFQIEQYKNYLIYVNADKGYSLVRHDFAENKKKVLLKNFGETEKSSFTDRLFFGKSSFMKPSEYMRLGKWLWIRENDKITPKIISIC
ncbi:MAG: hypothetical protein HDR05_13295 [Lachnospiraceae bacterium]|nr:hypothetical protein [Lachnospiraceae bacterium]